MADSPLPKYVVFVPPGERRHIVDTHRAVYSYAGNRLTYTACGYQVGPTDRLASATDASLPVCKTCDRAWAKRQEAA